MTRLLMVLIILKFMKKLTTKVFFTTIIVLMFLVFSIIYLNKTNLAVESNSRLLLLPNEIPLREEGERFYVFILLNTQTNKVLAVDSVIKFDHDILEVEDVVPYHLFRTYPESGRVIDNQKGLVYLSAINYDSIKKTFTSPFQNIGLFGRISFKVKKSLPTKIEFLYDPSRTDTTNIIEDKTGKNIIYNTGQLEITEIQ